MKPMFIIRLDSPRPNSLALFLDPCGPSMTLSALCEGSPPTGLIDRDLAAAAIAELTTLSLSMDHDIDVCFRAWRLARQLADQLGWPLPPDPYEARSGAARLAIRRAGRLIGRARSAVTLTYVAVRFMEDLEANPRRTHRLTEARGYGNLIKPDVRGGFAPLFAIAPLSPCFWPPQGGGVAQVAWSLSYHPLLARLDWLASVGCEEAALARLGAMDFLARCIDPERTPTSLATATAVVAEAWAQVVAPVTETLPGLLPTMLPVPAHLSWSPDEGLTPHTGTDYGDAP